MAGSRTSWVLRFEEGGRTLFLKIYRYPLPFGPLRGLFRNTFWAPSRARREWRALKHLASAGLQPDLAEGLWERRALGLLLEARLLTRGFPGRDLEARILEAPLPRPLLRSLATFVRGLHESGLRDPDLRLRNLLYEEGAGRFAKIDSSSSHLRGEGKVWDRARIRDLQGFCRDLEGRGLPGRELGRILVSQWFPGPRPPLLHRAWKRFLRRRATRG